MIMLQCDVLLRGSGCNTSHLGLANAVRAATHYNTRAWQMLIYGKESFIGLSNLINSPKLVQ